MDCREYVPAFKKNKIDGVALLKLNDAELRELGVGVRFPFAQLALSHSLRRDFCTGGHCCVLAQVVVCHNILLPRASVTIVSGEAHN